MPTMDTYPPGVPCWVDLQTPDVDAAVSFYTSLFGWETERQPIPGGGEYVFFTKDGHQVAACSQQGAESAAQGVPSVWTTYFAGDAEALARRAADAGGTVVLEAMDVMEEGRIALLADPTGAVFGIWQAGRHRGAALVNESGAVSWNELATTDLDAATAFYTDVFHFGTDEQPMGDEAVYRLFTVEDRQVCGAYALTPEMAGMPPHWACYFGVDDTDAAAEQAEEAGGKVLQPPQDSPYGRMAAVADPAGASFLVIELQPQE